MLDLQAGKDFINHVCGGFSVGVHRLETAGEKGLPQIVSPGSIEVFHWPTSRPLPPKFRNRRVHIHNSLLTIVSSSVDEQRSVGRLMAEKLNKAAGPTAAIIPMQERARASKLGLPDPKGLHAFVRALKKNLKPKVTLVQLDISSDDPAFTDEVMRLFDGMMQKKSVSC